jgi:hypothetical protein
MPTAEQISDKIRRGQLLQLSLTQSHITQEKVGNFFNFWDKAVYVSQLVEGLTTQYEKGDYNSQITILIYDKLDALLGMLFLNIPAPAPPIIAARVDWAYIGTDPSINLTNVAFQFHKNYAKGSTSLSLDFTSNANQNYLVVRLPATQAAFNKWFNTPLNQGDIPDQVYQTIQTIGDYQYIYTRDLAFIDPANTIITYNIA